MLLYAFLMTLAFLVGYAIRRGSICAVVATRMLIIDRRSARFRAFGVATAASGAVIIPLHWLFPDSTALSAGYAITTEVLLAGAAFGIGARINDACALGTLAHLTGGNLNYGATIVGMVSGAVLVTSLGSAKDVAAPLIASPLEMPSVGATAFAFALAGVLITALFRRVPRWLRKLHDPASVRMGPYRAMLVVGICGGLLYSLAGNWTYMGVLSQRASRLVDPTLVSEGWPALLCAVIVITGGFTAAWIHGNFDPRRPELNASLQCLLGGSVMGASAAIIPGGNGTLLIHGLPSLAPHAIAAYASMAVTLCLSFLMRRST